MHRYNISMQKTANIKNSKFWFLSYDLDSVERKILIEKICLLERKQANLWRGDFWRTVFFKVLNRHSFQKEFYLLSRTPTSQEVDFYLYKVFQKLQRKYELVCRRSTAKGFVQLDLSLSYLRFHSRKRRMINPSEIEVYIDENQITLSLLPYNAMVGKYYLDEYLIVENVINDLCSELFAFPSKEVLDFQNYRERIQTEEKSLNQKSIEIARSSIKILYEKYPEEDKLIFSGYLFSNLKINEKSEIILHKDFLENPQLLVSKLQKK